MRSGGALPLPKAQNGKASNFLQPNNSKLKEGYNIPSRYPSTELATSIGGEDGEPAYLIPSFKYGHILRNPVDEFYNTGDYLGGPFKTYQEADKWDIEVRHPYVEKGQPIPSPLKWWGEGYRQGGSLPKAQIGKKKGNPLEEWWYNLEDVRNSYNMYNDQDSFLKDWLLHVETQKRLKENLESGPFTRDINPAKLTGAAINTLQNTPVFSRELAKEKRISHDDIVYNNSLQGWDSDSSFGGSSYLSGSNYMTGINNLGAYNKRTKQIVVDSFDDVGTVAHEGIHATGPFQDTMEKIIDWKYFDKKDPKTRFAKEMGISKYNPETNDFTYESFEDIQKRVPGLYENYWLDKEKYLDEDGVYPRIMDIRRTLNLKPGQKVNQSIFNNESIYNPLEDLRHYYDDNTIIDMLNKLAKNNNSEQFNQAKQGGLAKAQVGSSVDFRVGPTVAKAKSLAQQTPFPVTLPNTAVQYINFQDNRVMDPVVKGKKIESTRRNNIDNVERDKINKIIEQAKVVGVDPATLLTNIIWETRAGETDDNWGHNLYDETPTIEGLDSNSEKANIAAQGLLRQLNLGKKKYPQGPSYKQLQAYQGYGALYPDTEKRYYKTENQAFYGIPVTKEKPLLTNKLFPYGKTIEQFRDSVVRPTLDKYGINYQKGGNTKDMVISDLWKQITGSSWSQAKKLGLTDGSYEQNIALREKLISSLNNQPAEKPQLNISSKAKPRVTPSIQRVAVNPMVQDASVVRPSNQQLAYEYYKTQPFGLTDPYSTVPLDIQYAMMQSASRQDKVYQTPTGLRAGTQGILNDINHPTNNDLVNTVSNFITYPVQAGVNIANTIAGDTPIRSDADVENLAWDATAVLPYARGLKNLTGKGIRGAAYRGIEPFDYGIVDKIKNFFPNLIGNTLDPTRQLRNITEKYKSTGVSAKKAERLGKNMLDSWATGLKIPQKYNTLKKVGDDTYRIANSKIQTDRLKNIWKEVNRYKRNSPNQQLITHASKDPKFSHSVYDFDSENALMGQYRWDVKKLSDGNIHFKSFDKYDLHPFGKRGAIFAKPESWVDEWRSKYFNKNLQDFEALGAIGGKPYNVENNYIFNPKTNKIVKKFNEGGVTYKVKINKPK